MVTDKNSKKSENIQLKNVNFGTNFSSRIFVHNLHF